MGKVFSGMCGIAGYINYHSTEIDKHYIEAAIQSLKKRGPDDDGYYATSKACIINTRLSIIDINNGHQPFQKIVHAIFTLFKMAKYTILLK